MNKLILTLVLLSSSAMAQVPTQECQNVPLPPRSFVQVNGQIVELPHPSYRQVCRIVMIPSQNTVPVPVAEQQQIQNLPR